MFVLTTVIFMMIVILFKSDTNTTEQSFQTSQVHINFKSISNENGQIIIKKDNSNILTIPTGFSNSNMFSSEISPNFRYGIANNFVEINGDIIFEPFVFDFYREDFIQLDSDFATIVNDLRKQNSTISCEYYWSPDSSFVYAKPKGLSYFGNKLYKIIITENEALLESEIILADAEYFTVEGFEIDSGELKVVVTTKSTNISGTDGVESTTTYVALIDSNGNVTVQ